MIGKLRRWGREALVMVLVLITIVVLMDWWRAPKMPTTFDSTPLQTLDGQTLTLNALSEERPLLLYFWASWCGVCRYTTPSVSRLVVEGENVMTIALRSGEPQAVLRWLEQKKVQLPVVNDASGELSRNWQVGVTPTLVVLYKGEVVSSTTGWTSYWGMKARLEWAAL
ncbi:ScsD family copper-sensitivity suppressor [Buttiauxella ferragutiae ATCC 51602]|uniref:ScsD family copper-sensitivity suppressor n=1 Tax=Buttiauxella ferragutiae ATCC 51602 TaxID=1354252 RepID=A0ABX2W6N4_9ENTR|nr:protein disulfide oxidoreductase [Buttiauxella ferragutiae]OAT26522.1 ScsD family copper-sensitivity suppressor [Buttiauxella ferragutiae ATCC 51602]